MGEDELAGAPGHLRVHRRALMDPRQRDLPQPHREGILPTTMHNTKYARSSNVSLAYQVIGEEPIDLVYLAGWVTNIEAMWEDPGYARFLRRLASFSRLIIYDKRGVGLSDPVPANELAEMGARIEDPLSVMDAVGSSKATLFGHSEGGATGIRLAARYPERVDRLIVTGGVRQEAPLRRLPMGADAGTTQGRSGDLPRGLG